MDEHTLDVLIDTQSLAARIEAMGREIASVIDDDWVVIGLLQGAVPFAADLMRALARAGRHPLTDWLWLSSYGDARASSGRVQIRADVSKPVEGRGVLIVDDVFDTGRTLTFARDHLASQGATRVLTAVLARKPASVVTGEPDWIGFELPDRYLVGYGLDDAGRGRGIPFLGAVKT